MQARSDKIRGALVEGMEEENLCFLTLSRGTEAAWKACSLGMPLGPSS